MRACTLSLVVLLTASSAYAQAPAATALFEQGRVALDAGDFETACARFHAANKLDPTPGIAANIGICEERRGRLASAWEAFKVALEKLPAGDKRIARIQEQITSLESRLPRLVLVLAPSAPKDTTVRDGDATIGNAGTYGVALPFDPGAHHLTVLAPGRAAATVDVVLVEGKTATLAIEAGPAEIAPSTPTPLAPSMPAESSSSGPWIVGGIGVAGLVLAAVTGGLVVSNRSTVTDNCDDKAATCRTQSGIDAANAVRTLGPVTTVGLVIGAVGVATGAIWLGVQRSGRSSARIGVGPTMGGVAWRAEASW